MYDASDDPYTYDRSTVLRNKLDLREAADLNAFEAEISTQRATEPLPGGELDFAHYCAVHHHLFQDVYEWAGKPRSVRIAKGGNPFCFPENIERVRQISYSANSRPQISIKVSQQAMVMRLACAS